MLQDRRARLHGGEQQNQTPLPGRMFLVHAQETRVLVRRGEEGEETSDSREGSDDADEAEASAAATTTTATWELVTG